MSDNSYDQFILFGKISTKEKRKKLVDYIKARLNDSEAYSDTLDEDKLLKPFLKTVNTISRNKEIKDLCQKNEKIKDDIVQRLLNQIENLHQETSLKGPNVKEELELRKWKEKEVEPFLKESEKFFVKISKYYSENEYNYDFFRKELEKITDKEKKNESQENNDILRKEALKNEMIERWESLLLHKKHINFLKELDKAREKFTEELYKQIEQLEVMQKILQPFAKELGRLWDLSIGIWQNVGFDLLEKYAILVEKEPEIQKLAEYLGRLHEEENELEEKEIEETVIKQIFEIDHAGKSELVGIHESDDFNHLLPSELSLLDNPTTENIFYVKLLEKKLLTYKLMGYDLGTKEEKSTKTELIPKAKKKGPIIVCVDTSGSMHGTPEYVAKVLCFAILRIALLEERNCYLISFSTSIYTLELTNFKDSLSDLIEFLAHSFHGGTDATPALKEAVKQIKTKKYKKVDVLMISDFIMGQVEQEVEKDIINSKVGGTRFHSLVISSAANPKVLEIFDNNWLYNTRSKKPFQDILNKINLIKFRPNN